MKAKQTDTNARGTSKYAQKVRERRQMYGTSTRCCGHRHVPAILESYTDGDKEVFSELTE